MGQKVHPNGIRLGIIRTSKSCWFPSDNESYADLVHSDMQIRDYISKHLPNGAAVSSLHIERTGNKINILIKTAKPGIIIGKKGEGIEKLRKSLSIKLNGKVHINVEEIRKPEIDSVLVAESVAQQLEKRIMFRRAMKRAMANALRQGAKGIKIAVAGRLGGAEIARTESYREGRVPLHTFRADIDYGTAEAKTTYGIIGVKVWIFKGEVIGDPREKQAQEITA
jgi:small subunit ribosomal protein S3